MSRFVSQWLGKTSNKSLSHWVRKTQGRSLDRKTQGRSLDRYVRRVINRSTFIEEKLNNLEIYVNKLETANKKREEKNGSDSSGVFIVLTGGLFILYIAGRW